MSGRPADVEFALRLLARAATAPFEMGWQLRRGATV
jgi:hypothetical protein